MLAGKSATVCCGVVQGTNKNLPQAQGTLFLPRTTPAMAMMVQQFPMTCHDIDDRDPPHQGKEPILSDQRSVVNFHSTFFDQHSRDPGEDVSEGMSLDRCDDLSARARTRTGSAESFMWKDLTEVSFLETTLEQCLLSNPNDGLSPGSVAGSPTTSAESSPQKNGSTRLPRHTHRRNRCVLASSGSLLTQSVSDRKTLLRRRRNFALNSTGFESIVNVSLSSK